MPRPRQGSRPDHPQPVVGDAVHTPGEHPADHTGATAGAASDRSAPVRIERPRWRAVVVRATVLVIVVAQIGLIVRSYSDPHNLFGFQPFNESSTWSAEIVRVLPDGSRVSIDEPWPGGYDWDELVGWRVLQNPGRTKHAFSGSGAVLDFLDEALDWIADNTPDDRETVRLEATVTVDRNAHGPTVVTMRSDDRDEVAP